MSFSLHQFYQANRRALIWVILAAVLWLLRDFFTLIFLTFILAFIATPLARAGRDRLRLPPRGALVLVYLLFLVLLASFVRYATPAVIREANLLVGNLGAIQARLVEVKTEVVDRYPGLRRTVPGYIRSVLGAERLAAVNEALAQERDRLALSESDIILHQGNGESPPTPQAAALERYYALEDQLLINEFLAEQMTRLRSHAPEAINVLYRATATMLLALLFSFLILNDIARLSAQVRSLSASRLRDFYEAAAQPVVRFGYVVGRAFQAQAMIAAVNTCLTLIGLLVLAVPSVTMLSLIVFVCGFIPVLGTFISTVPMVLVALNAGGPGTALAVVAFVVGIHTLEAYVLNPLIYGQHFNLNPVLVLIVLFIAYHAFGIWGMLLGVPVTQYLLNDVFGVPVWSDKRLQRVGAAPAPPEP